MYLQTPLFSSVVHGDVHSTQWMLQKHRLRIRTGMQMLCKLLIEIVNHTIHVIHA